MDNMVKLPAPADKIVADFVNQICGMEPGFIKGVYLTGSLTMNDFYCNKSDIDFLVLCKSLPEGKTAAQLKHIHTTISRQFPKPDLSGSYLASDSLGTGRPEAIRTLSYHEGSMGYRNLDMAAVSLTELKSNAFTLYGIPSQTLPVNMEQGCLNSFLYNNINTYWTRWISRHSSFFNRKILLLLLPRLTEWSVLGVARQLCTLQTGKIVSKTEAGLYCLEYLPRKFHPLIQEALRIRKDNRRFPLIGSYAIRPSFKRLQQTIEGVNYMMVLFNKAYGEKPCPAHPVSPGGRAQAEQSFQ